ncbi:hypothetical protein PGB90_010632 [Kerria lacca]
MAPVPRCSLRLPSDPSKRKESKEYATSKPRVISTTTSAVKTAEDVEDKTIPEAADGAVTKDSAEILQDSSEFSSRLTRDAVEVREHKIHEGMTEGESEDTCSRLQQCKVYKKDETDDEATADAVAACIKEIATPGDLCAKFCKDRAGSPSSASYRKDSGRGVTGKRKGKRCRAKYALSETYTSLYGSSTAVNIRKKFELEMKKKRKYLEKLHERNRQRRVKEKRRAKEKRIAMRCRDQSKIPETKDDISINKAFHFRFNYNKKYPFMPSAMNQHLKKFKKPPFKHFLKGTNVSFKQVDEFEKLRVTDTK